MRPSPIDLFGEVPVTQDDVDAWVLATMGFEPGSPRAARYAQAWDVARKIKEAKLGGTFEDAVRQARR